MRNKKALKAYTTAAVAALLLSACGGNSGADAGEESYTFTLSVVTPDEGMISGTNWWMDEIESRTDGQITFDVYYNESLLSGPETMDAINDGRITGGWFSDAYYQEELPLFQLSGIPFETSDPYANARALYQLYQDNEDFRQEIQDTGAHFSHIVPYSQTVFATPDPLESGNDLVGQRFRAAGTMSGVLSELGADSVFLDVSEIYESLERGVINGAAGYEFSLAADAGVAEAAPYITDIGYGHYAATAIAVDLDWYENLPEDLREVFDEVSQELQEEQYPEFLAASEQDSCDVYEEQGAVVEIWSEEQTAELEDTVGDTFVEQYKDNAIAAGYEAQTVETIYDDFHNLYEKYTADSPYTNYVEECAERLGN